MNGFPGGKGCRRQVQGFGQGVEQVAGEGGFDLEVVEVARLVVALVVEGEGVRDGGDDEVRGVAGELVQVVRNDAVSGGVVLLEGLVVVDDVFEPVGVFSGIGRVGLDQIGMEVEVILDHFVAVGIAEDVVIVVLVGIAQVRELDQADLVLYGAALFPGVVPRETEVVPVESDVFLRAEAQRSIGLGRHAFGDEPVHAEREQETGGK